MNKIKEILIKVILIYSAGVIGFSGIFILWFFSEVLYHREFPMLSISFYYWLLASWDIMFLSWCSFIWLYKGENK